MVEAVHADIPSPYAYEKGKIYTIYKNPTVAELGRLKHQAQDPTRDPRLKRVCALRFIQDGKNDLYVFDGALPHDDAKKKIPNLNKRRLCTGLVTYEPKESLAVYTGQAYLSDETRSRLGAQSFARSRDGVYEGSASSWDK